MSALRAFLIAAAASCPLLAIAAPGYQLRFFDPDNFDARALNNRGQVLGMVGGAPAIWSRSGIDMMPVADPIISCDGISDAGDIACTRDDNHTRRAIVYVNRTVHDIFPVKPSQDLASQSAAISDNGMVVGTESLLIGEDSHAFIYRDNRITLIGTLPGGDYSEAYAVSESGYVTGDGNVHGPWDMHAFLFRDGLLLDLGTLGGSSSSGRAVNNAGQVAGWANTSQNDRHAFLYSGQRMVDLGTLGGAYASAFAINNAGAVVGESTTDASETVRHGFLYRNGTTVDLNALIPAASGWTIVSASAINDRNEILAQACQQQACRPVLLTPAAAR